MTDFEKLGAFYLGRRYDMAAGALADDLVLYDAKDLTTHAVIVGMTGSGKTGLGIGLIEEAALDLVPVIAIDPKGDLGNLLLTFPELRPADFAPWVQAQDAAAKGLTTDQYAAAQAETWRKGLAEWGQAPDRIARLRAAADFGLYTPGSTVAPLAVLRSFAVPPVAVRDDADLFRERVQTTATSVLALLGVDADPLASREHILLANVLQRAWAAGTSLDLPGLIAQVQEPPFDTIGVMAVEQVFPRKDRLALAMQLNNLLAAPGFEAWTQGPPLDAGALLFSPTGKPRISVLSIAHLGDRERMFFVAMLLNEVIGWMRQQSGTGSLRAILYMDEIAGYLPPVANPASKPPFLTLLKQARAYGLGVVVATQNPADLDYKALANAGTWFLGRLQTERDKARVMEGLEGAAHGGAFERAAMDQLLSGLGKRTFLLHSVHESRPEVFQTRWALSYLAGPLTREQLRRLVPAPDAAPAAPPPAVAASGTPVTDPAAGPPAVPPSIRQFHLPPTGRHAAWQPGVLGIADVGFSSARHGVDASERVALVAPLAEGPIAVDWGDADRLDLEQVQLAEGAPSPGHFAPLPIAALTARDGAEWEKGFGRWLRANHVLALWKSPSTGLVSRPGETEGAFRARARQAAREQRDERVRLLREKYAPRLEALRQKHAAATARVAREQGEANASMLEGAMRVGTALLGGLLSRKKVSATNAGRLGTAVRGVGRASAARGDVDRAEQGAAQVEDRLAALEQELQAEVARLEAGAEVDLEPLEPVILKPKAGTLQVHAVGLLWR
ncbi:MAG: ATP-binding protein [Gemmatimonadales bacterium]|nr:ATP-binding protein [Gemmatimonadales bacterium]